MLPTRTIFDLGNTVGNSARKAVDILTSHFGAELTHDSGQLASAPTWIFTSPRHAQAQVAVRMTSGPATLYLRETASDGALWMLKVKSPGVEVQMRYPNADSNPPGSVLRHAPYLQPSASNVLLRVKVDAHSMHEVLSAYFAGAPLVGGASHVRLSAGTPITTRAAAPSAPIPKIAAVLTTSSPAQPLFGSTPLLVPTGTFDNAVHQHAHAIFEAAKPVICLHSLGGRRWRRNVASGARVGPWLSAEYNILDHDLWKATKPCLYLVAGQDRQIRYVGISRNGLSHRWRLSPAIDAETMRPLPEKKLFHSQCWKHIERESSADKSAAYEVRVIQGDRLVTVLERLGPPLSGFAALGDDAEGLVASVERWMCNNRSAQLVTWNVAMTG